MADIMITNHHSIVLVLPLTKAARQWIDDHIPSDAQWFGRSLVVEPRYLGDICAGMEEDGLTISAGRVH